MAASSIEDEDGDGEGGIKETCILFYSTDVGEFWGLL